MSLMTTLIASVCVGLSGADKDACTNGLDAGSKQYGIQQDVDSAENKTNKEAIKESYSLLGNGGTKVLGGSLFMAKAAYEKSLTLQMPTMGLCNFLTSEVKPNAYNLKMEWKY